jgi:hypothetical protein
MRASNRKRLEKLEKNRPTDLSLSVIIFDPANPVAISPIPEGSVRILIPDNGRQRQKASCDLHF